MLSSCLFAHDNVTQSKISYDPQSRTKEWSNDVCCSKCRLLFSRMEVRRRQSKLCPLKTPVSRFHLRLSFNERKFPIGSFKFQVRLYGNSDCRADERDLGLMTWLVLGPIIENKTGYTGQDGAPGVFGQRPRRGRSPVEHRGTFVRSSVRSCVPPSLRPLRPQIWPLRPQIRPLRPQIWSLRAQNRPLRPTI